MVLESVSVTMVIVGMPDGIITTALLIHEVAWTLWKKHRHLELQMFRQLALQLLFCLTVLLAPALAVAQNVPLSKAAVGDWVELKGEAATLVPFVTVTSTMRFTVKAKSEKTATIVVTVKSPAGDEVSESESEWPLDKPFDFEKMAALAGAAAGDVKVTLEKIPDLKHKIKNKEFQGTGYKYKMAVDLFRGLDIPEAEKGKPVETTITYLVTPDAPVVGIAVISLKGLANVRYELSDGTGVAAILEGK